MITTYAIRKLAAVAALVGIMAFATSSTMADVGYRFDYAGLSLSYETDAGPGGKVGTLTAQLPGFLALEQLDLGGDGFGGSNDTLLDVTSITGSSNMDLAFSADVVKLGTNNYQIVGTVSGSDLATGTNSHEAGLLSTTVNYIDLGAPNGGVFSFAGNIFTYPANDAILINRAAGGNEWVFVGQGPPNPGDPDGDGAAATVTLMSGREGYDIGGIALFELGVDSVPDLDVFFSENREYQGGDMKLTVVSAPGAVILGAIGLGLIAWMRRRRKVVES